MNKEINNVKIGVLLAIMTLLFGIIMGVSFGIAEDSFQTYITNGISAHPDLHDAKSADKIWRDAQRAHFHAMGISAFAIGLIILVMFSSLKIQLKQASSILIGFSGLYPLSWFSMFYFSPSLGRTPVKV